MTLHSLIYLFFFMPAFFLVYRLVRPKRRKWLIAAADIAFIASGGVRGLLIYAVCLAAAYFSGRIIDQKSGQPGGLQLCKKILIGNVLLNAVCFVLFAKDAIHSGFALAGGGVIALHLISYVADVYRGCKPADIAVLTAYSAFFPSASTGLVMRYRRVSTTFETPEPDVNKLGKGLRLYVFGLTEYLLIACRLNDIWNEIMSLPGGKCGGAAAWLTALIWYGAFISGITSQLIMGQGTAIMLGFHVRQPYRRKLFSNSLYERMSGVSVHLSMWIKDYVTDPVRRITGKKSAAAAAGMLSGALWMCFGYGGLVGGIFAAAAIALQTRLTSGQKEKSVVRNILYTKLFTVFTGICLAVFAMLPHGMPDLNVSLTDDDMEMFFYLIKCSWLPLAAALFINGAMLPTALKRMNTRWLSFVLPVLELIALVLCAAYMMNG